MIQMVIKLNVHIGEQQKIHCEENKKESVSRDKQ